MCLQRSQSDLPSSTRPVEYRWNCTQRTPGLEAQFAAGGDIWGAEATSGGRALLEEAVCWVLGSKCFPTPLLFLPVMQDLELLCHVFPLP